MKLLYGYPEGVASWVAERIPHVGPRGFSGPVEAIGIATEEELVAGVVYHDYQPACGTMQLSMAAVSPRWATRGNIRALLAYPFDAVKVNKLWTATPSTNARALRFNKGIGFKPEGTLRHQFGPGVHAIISSIMAKEWHKMPWRSPDGQE